MFFGWRILILWMFVLTASLACAGESLKKEVQSRPLLGTIVTIEVCQRAGDIDQVSSAFRLAWQRLDEINVRMNHYDAASDVSLLNKAAGQAVKVHDDVVELIRRSQEFRRITGGVFDVTIAPLSRLWKESAKKDQVPSQEDIARAKRLVDAGKIELLPEGWVRLPDPETQLDLNGDAQGFAADEAAKILRGAGLKDFLVDTGGEIFASGLNCEVRKWQVGIGDPSSPGKTIEVAELSDAALSTSGDYEKYFEIQGRKWSHIIDPLTGYPVTGAASVTVIAPTATEADAYSTALCVLGVEKGLSFISTLGPGYEALIYWRGENERLSRQVTSGYNRYVRQAERN
jgi:thiamine biosynthesis lipoprotein ApbE